MIAPAPCSRISLTIGSSVSERVFQASRSVFTLRQVRLTTAASCPLAPVAGSLHPDLAERIPEPLPEDDMSRICFRQFVRSAAAVLAMLMAIAAPHPLHAEGL